MSNSTGKTEISARNSLSKPELKEEIQKALRGHQADYIEIRLEESRSNNILYRGREVQEAGGSSNLGGNVRALVKGGWGFISFNDLTGLADKVKTAVKQASLINGEKRALAHLEPHREDVIPAIKKNPFGISLSIKKKLLDEYNGIVYGVPGIHTSVLTYNESLKNVVFASSEGSFISQQRLDMAMRLSAIARDGSEIQQDSLSLGNNNDFGIFEGLHKEVEETVKRAVSLLSAPQAKGGEYSVILDPSLAGVFVHEAFGHLSEADHIYENPSLKELMVLGKTFGEKHLNIIDGAAVPGLRGSYKYDDEGVPAHKTYLIRDGVLVGRLHSRETAAKLGEELTGNARAIDYRFPPLVRMTNTFIDGGTASFEDMLSDIKDGIYARDWYGGTTSMEMFTFSAAHAYKIRNGRLEEMLRPVVLTGNVFQTLKNIDAIGKDLSMSQKGGGCGKGGQMPLPVSEGSPHIRIRKCLISGK